MNNLAYLVATKWKSALAAGLLAGAALTLGCTAGVMSTTGRGGAGGSGPGAGGTTGVAGSGPGSGGSAMGTGGTIMTNPDAGPSMCQQGNFKFTPKIPTVYLLVDRSGSMFHCLSGNTGDAVCADQTNTAWAKLKTAVEAVVSPLESQVRFGFMTIWGTNPAGPGGTCPSLQGMATDNVSPALNNAAAITAKYDSLPFAPNSTQVGVKFESPASESIAVASTALQADTTPGDKFIIFITDGQPDYCDDSNGLCAPDSVVGQLQAAKTAGVTTVVLGLQTALFDLGSGILQAFANAGAGEPTVAPLRPGGTVNDFYDQCNGLAGWHADLVALGKPNARGTTLGTYSATAGPTMPHMPSASDQTMLVSQLSAALSGVKSCTFDLSDPTMVGHAIKVNRDQLSKAGVMVQGMTVPLDPNNMNGWDMISDTQLQLFGTACDAWHNPDVTDIAFNFPCDIIVE